MKRLRKYQSLEKNLDLYNLPSWRQKPQYGKIRKNGFKLVVFIRQNFFHLSYVNLIQFFEFSKINASPNDVRAEKTSGTQPPIITPLYFRDSLIYPSLYIIISYSAHKCQVPFYRRLPGLDRKEQLFVLIDHSKIYAKYFMC